MQFLKNNLKVIIAFIVGVILAGGIVYAATSAREVSYVTDKNAEIKNVEDALNDLYANKKILHRFLKALWIMLFALKHKIIHNVLLIRL